MAKGSLLALRDYRPRRIALIKPSALGDIIHSLPVLTALRRRFPTAQITWIVNRSYAPLLQGHPDLDAVLPFDRSAAQQELMQAALGYGQFFRSLRKQRFDLVIDLQGLLRSGLMALATGSPRRVGLGSAREGASLFYTDVVPVADFKRIHAVDRYWLVAEAIGAGDGPRTFVLPIKDAARDWAGQLLRGQPRPWVMVAAGSRWMTKRWPPEHFATLLRKAQERFGGTVVFVGTPDEAELGRAIARRLHGNSMDQCGQTTLPQLAALLARADVMVANDTGPLHLATALGRRVVAPYTCTKVGLNGPYGGESGAVESRVWCQGSYLKRCDRLECMTELTPFRMWPALLEVLQQWEYSRSA